MIGASMVKFNLLLIGSIPTQISFDETFPHVNNRRKIKSGLILFIVGIIMITIALYKHLNVNK